jgi:hypothetical protein
MMRFARTTVGLGLTALLLGPGCSKKSAEPETAGASAPKKPGKVVKPGHAKKPGGPDDAAKGRNAPVVTGDVAEKPKQPDKGHFTLAYQGADSPMRKLVRDSGVFEQVVPELDKALNLPHDIPITFQKCETVNAFYDPQKISITMCDEMVDFYGELFADYPKDEGKEAIVGSLVSVFLHEMGHALIDQLQLPAVGRQEDAADQLATVVLVASGDEGNRMALDGAFSWVAEGKAQGDDTTPFWDEHSLNEQRFYNMMCLIYGSNPDGYGEVIGENELPSDRAEQCPDEYKTISGSWNKLLAPYLSVPVMRMTLAKKHD